ncbi:MAG TPA: FAD-dependent thymidylate synthase [Vicinamibacterales bacterium]|nr:FAD-dependent thymidylate synthase [Vicinamibacterales bacterium]
MIPAASTAESFSKEERQRLAPYFTNLDGHVFALTNLPETVKGALFARYSRSSKSLRRLFLDEFAAGVGDVVTRSGVGVERAEKLYARVFNDYGDDSVAQLGGAHVACEYASNILTKVLEWGRLMAYLEQSTRYVPYTDRLHGRWRYHIPAEIPAGALRADYAAVLDRAFETYAKWIPPMQDYFARRYPKGAADSDAVHRAAIRAKALDTLRGMLPAATQSNVGIYGTGQAYEALLLRMRASPLLEVHAYAGEMLAELRKVIPAFLVRVDQADRGGRWSEYLADTRRQTASVAATLLDASPEPREEVTLTDFDPDGEMKIVAAALYAVSDLPDDQLLDLARRMPPDDRLRVLRSYIGARSNRRHRPGRAFERATYRFDVLTDYGAFRDLQRHRLLTLEWQPLTPRHGCTEPDAIREAGAGDDWQRVLDASAGLYERLAGAGLTAVASYAVSMAYRIRFYMEMNAREAMHMIELRTAPQGHPAYRRVCQRMHTLIAEQAGHKAIAAAMQFADHSAVELERLGSERELEKKKLGDRRQEIGDRR